MPNTLYLEDLDADVPSSQPDEYDALIWSSDTNTSDPRVDTNTDSVGVGAKEDQDSDDNLTFIERWFKNNPVLRVTRDGHKCRVPRPQPKKLHPDPELERFRAVVLARSRQTKRVRLKQRIHVLDKKMAAAKRERKILCRILSQAQ
ncbi:hypothetical protein MIND_01080400 [Mycena indigotica]|uniref:Uncharacterized protein n=1 Tax=Mycena indigotica TaxID=2126181 RepID=A0A8H6S9P4_9AGAR|nr:uncharacterized protein MIND_01080400 [Mycena indigotica]KAF7295408.1 hypothetical protein MIND_01080400 [Mycena indigotica]